MKSKKTGRPGGLHRELPAGVADILPATAERLISLRRSLLDTMALWGYRPVHPPVMEHAEVFSRALTSGAEELSFYRFVDPSTGRALSFRTDFTPQLARIAATRFPEAGLPLRLFYDGPVLRHVPGQRGMKRELHQVGAELMGLSDPEADAECIALLIDCLIASGLRDFRIDVGQVEFFKGIFKDVEINEEELEKITRATARKDISELAKILRESSLPEQKKALLAELPLLAGGVEVLERAGKIVESGHSREALENLGKVLDFVRAYGLIDHITVDLGEIRGIDYYTGVIFEAFVRHVGTPLCRGGRYDRLVERYGLDLPATGLSIDLFALSEALNAASESENSLNGVFIINFLPKRDAALGLATALRSQNVRACRDIVKRPLEDSLALAREQLFRYAAVLGSPGLKEGEVLLIDLADGSRKTVAAGAVPEAAAAFGFENLHRR
ncbi:ATP phosphoribosyltransferase regulatory subunit [bacterium]|nr:MAG: ATP phosphoribosyltransferase regulatory subunit [bacterium]